MPLQFDPATGKITYRGQEVGQQVFEDGKSIVRINIQFETAGEWIVPVSWLAYGLTLLPENGPLPVVLELQTPADGIEQEFDVVRFLTEKQVKRSGYVWKFHKTDVDPWPSPLHGHDYDKGLKLDVLTGDIFDVGTRQRCKKLKEKKLQEIRSALRASDDFKELMMTLLPEGPTGGSS